MRSGRFVGPAMPAPGAGARDERCVTSGEGSKTRTVLPPLYAFRCMRGWSRLLLLAVLLVLVGAPAVQAQALRTDVEVRVDPLPAPVRPLVERAVTNVTIELPCAVPGAPPGASHVHLWVERMPSWASATVVPSVLQVSAEQCTQGRIVERAQLVLGADVAAPAFRPETVHVAASWVEARPNLTGRGDVEMMAAFFPLLDAALERASADVAPGEVVFFPLKVSNGGNAATRVLVEVVNATNGVAAHAPQPLVLGSRTAGDAAELSSGTILLEVRAPSNVGYHDQSGLVTYRIVHHHEDDPSLVGAPVHVSVVLTTQGITATPGADASLILPLLLAVAVGFAGRARARQQQP